MIETIGVESLSPGLTMTGTCCTMYSTKQIKILKNTDFIIAVWPLGLS